MNRSFKTGTPIWVYYMDIDSHENLVVPQLLQGFLGDEFTVEKREIPGYHFMKHDGELSGTFDMKPHTIKLMYRHENWENVEDDIDVFLRIKQPTTVYDAVEGMPIGTPISPGIIIKSFQRVTTFDHQVWYEVAADQWAKFDDETLELVSQPFPELDLHKEPETTSLNEQKINSTGTVNYVSGGALPIYDAPYGKIVDHAADGVSFTINAELDDDNGVKWYHVARRGYVNAMYIDLI